MLLDNSKTFLTVKNSLHTPIVHEDKFVTDFQVKSEIFNSHFAKQCSLLKNESQIPPQLLPHTNTCLSTVRFSENDILKVIRKLDPSKAHGHDKISIRMLKLNDKGHTGIPGLWTQELDAGIWTLDSEPWTLKS